MSSSRAAAVGEATAWVPEAILRTLRRAIHRTRMIILLRGAFAVLAIAVGALLVIMGVDAIVPLLSTGVRWALTLGAFAVTAAALGWFVVRPLRHTSTFTGMARRLEQHHPEFEERISSTVELLTSDDTPEFRGSDALITELAQEATGEARVVRPEREFTVRPARPYIVAASAVVAVLAVLFVAWPRQTSLLFVRAVAPHSDLGNLGSFDLRVSPGDVVLPRGTPLRVDVTVGNPTAQTAELGASSRTAPKAPTRWPASRPMGARSSGSPSRSHPANRASGTACLRATS